MDRARTGIIHVHSDWSHDGLDPLPALREFAAERGIGFVGLTDHAEDLEPTRFPDYVEACRAASDARVTLIPGLEYRFPGAKGLHLLALGLTRYLEPGTPVEFVRQARGSAGLTIMAHPVLTAHRVPPEVLAGLDAIEVWNGAYNTRYLPDPLAIRLLHAARRDRPATVATVGPDQHDRRNDRELRIVLDRVAESPLAEIRAGRFTNVGRTMRFDPAVSWSAGRVAALRAVRLVYDRVERIQDRLARWAR